MNLRPIFLRHLAQTSDEPMLLQVERAEGVYLFDEQARRYIDCISGIAVSNVGHADPSVTEAIRTQAGRYLHTMVYGEHVQSPQVGYAQALTQALGPRLDRVYFVNSGSEATEGALKLAKKFTGRSRIIAFHESYHGSTHGSLSVTGADWLKEGYGPFLPQVEFVSFNSPQSIEAIDEATACVIMEPIQAEAGVRMPTPGFLQAIRQRCTEVGALLVFDEIQTGMGRTGSLFAHQAMEVMPDILTLGKALGGGMPLGAFISRTEIMQVLSHDPVLGHITTFGGHPVCCAAGMAAFTKIQAEGLQQRAAELGDWLMPQLRHPLLGEVRGQGLLIAVDFRGSFEELLAVAKTCWKNGLLIDWFLHNNQAFRWAPPLIVSKDELRAALDIFLNALDEHSHFLADQG